MFSALLAIMLLPITDLGRSKGLQFRPLSKIFFYIFVANFLVLMQLGAKHVESPFIELGQISTALYFAHFVLIVPVLSIIENTLVDLNTFQISIIRPSLGKVPKGKRDFHTTKSLSVYEGIDPQTLSDACISSYTASKDLYYQAVVEYANLKTFISQYGHTINFNFNMDNTIPESVKTIAGQKFETILQHVNNASEQEENGRALLRALHRVDTTNLQTTTKITPSITEMHVVKSTWQFFNGR